ncbi:cytochrome C [Aestuariicella hydrocarbonica]|uniref:Cytochrome C n=1 Tax=Pseudomaricurvus hydrocarbonicus TaxID=1470433 RepID=A0A9E5MP57_9GAMM|nr:cytochrome C [Aestuariicella hydrocarbonica]
MLSLAGCDTGPKSGKGFTLPEGDPQMGRQVFIGMQCTDCHFLANDSTVKQPDNPQFSIPLGGEVRRIQTYGELVTSVINPSHSLPSGYQKEAISDNGQSRMRNYNDIMTVTQLTHLITFLQDQYELQPFEPSMYPSFH